MTVYISMDGETWGKRAGCDARSIGACVFNPFSPLDLVNTLPYDHPDMQEHVFYVALDNPLRNRFPSDFAWSEKQLAMCHSEHRKYDLHRDEDTVDWWFDPEQAEAAKAFANPVDLREGLEMFNEWLRSKGVNPKDEASCQIWSHGAAYDPPIVEAWYHAAGVPVPWHYRAPRDTRTLFDRARVGNHSKWVGAHRRGTHHHALADSSTQGSAIVNAIKRIDDAMDAMYGKPE